MTDNELIALCDRIDSLAAKVTPGPWCVENLAITDYEGEDAKTFITAFANDDGTEGAIIATVNRWSYGDDPPTKESVANATYFATLDPATIQCITAAARRSVEYSLCRAKKETT